MMVKEVLLWLCVSRRAPPADNEANEVLIEYLSEILGVPKSKLDIVAGISGRDKLISVVDMDVETVHQRILAHLG